MDAHTRDALERLTAIIPLAARQAALPEAWRTAHRALLAGYAATGRPPSAADLGGDAEPLLARLAQDDLAVRDAAGEIAGAYPFTSEATPHVVNVGTATVHAMCAVDALAIAPLLGTATSITSRCAACGAEVYVAMDGAEVTSCNHAELMVGIHWQTPYGHTAHSLCRQMVFLADPVLAATWAAEAPAERRVYTLEQAIALGAAFFVPLLA